MNNATSTRAAHPRWATYLRAVLFLAPPLAAVAVLTVFVNPKLKQMCHDVGLDAHQIFGIFEFFRNQGVPFVVIVVAFILSMERYVAKWPRYRSLFVEALVFLLNSAAVVGITGLVIVATLAASALLKSPGP